MLYVVVLSVVVCYYTACIGLLLLLLLATTRVALTGRWLAGLALLPVRWRFTITLHLLYIIQYSTVVAMTDDFSKDPFTVLLYLSHKEYSRSFCLLLCRKSREKVVK